MGETREKEWVRRKEECRRRRSGRLGDWEGEGRGQEGGVEGGVEGGGRGARMGEKGWVEYASWLMMSMSALESSEELMRGPVDHKVPN